MFISFIYDLALSLFALFCLPKMLYARIRQGKYKGSFGQRFGIGLHIPGKEKRKVVWIHAVSMGETRAVEPLVKRLKQHCPDLYLLISTTTEAGQQEAKKSIPYADAYIFLPFDLSWIIKRVVAKVKPDLVILMESDFWYNFLRFSKALGAHIALVNGKISERSAKRLCCVSAFTKRLFSYFEVMCVQNALYKERFLSLGAPDDKLVVTENIKFDANPGFLGEKEKQELRAKLGIREGQQVLVLGSTHAPEEKMLISVLQQLWVVYPDLKVVFVPRHQERISPIANQLSSAGIGFDRFSAGETANKLVIVDVMGILKQCYQVATVALVAGSYTPTVGGHNILEPCAYGVPVVFGPHMHTQPDMVMLYQLQPFGMQVSDGELFTSLKRLFSDLELYQQFSKAGVGVSKSLQGVTERVFAEISPLMQ